MLIGITGGIGSGKSTVLRVIAEQGYPVYDCDAQAKRIIAEDMLRRSGSLLRIPLSAGS